MTGPDRMVVWLRETLDAVQRDAEAAAKEEEPDWSDGGEYGESVTTEPHGQYVAVGPWDCPLPDGVRRHIARHDPTAILRQIDRHRKILDLHTTPHTVIELAVEPVGELFCGECDGPCTHKGEAECVLCGQDGCDSLRLLAEGYGWTEETT